MHSIHTKRSHDVDTRLLGLGGSIDCQREGSAATSTGDGGDDAFTVCGFALASISNLPSTVVHKQPHPEAHRPFNL